MPSISTTISLQDKMSSVLKKIHSTSQSVQQGFNSIGSSVDTMSAKMNKVASSSASMFNSLMQFSIVQKGINLFIGSLDSAITRMDTLNNFPKTMSNLGISTEDSQTAIDYLSAKLDGLPTTLNDAAASVQRFTSANGNIGKSTEMFLALNNAILAGGATMEIQSSALEQLSQSYTKGKPDMMEWRTAMMAMPAQLKQIAKAMGFVNADALGESLRKGTTSMDKFMNTIIQLNKEGVDGFQSLEEQAKNSTGGMRTALANFKSAINRGVASVIESVNKGLKQLGLPEIQQLISKTGKAIETLFKKIGTGIQKVMQFLKPIIDRLREVYNYINDNWTKIEPIINDIVYALVAVSAAMLAIKAASVIWSLFTDPAKLAIVAIVALVAYLMYLWDTSEEAAYNIQYALDVLSIAWQILSGIVKAVVYSIVVFILFMWKCINEKFFYVQLGLEVLQVGFTSLELTVQGVCEGIVNYFIRMYNKVADIINRLGGNMETIELVDFTSDTRTKLDELSSKLLPESLQQRKAEHDREMADIDKNLRTYSDKLYDTYVDLGSLRAQADKLNATRDSRVFHRENINEKVAEETQKTMENLQGAFGDILGTDATGGTAVKTTSTDEISLNDEDIQLLLDLATRDYKLNYQSITPNVTFGDINVSQTADMEDAMDVLANSLEEIYASNLEVTG